MQRVIVVFIACLIQFQGYSKQAFKKIPVSKDIELIQVSENAYVHVSWANFENFGRVPCNGLVYIQNREAFLFDTPATDSMTKELVNYLRDSLKLEIKGFVPNHWHSDCMGGLGYLQSQKIESYASQKTIKLAKSNHLPVPAHGFKDSLQLRLGDKLINCYYFGPAHSLDNIVVWIPSEKILFAGCMVKSMASEDLGNTADGDLVAYPKTIELVLKRFGNARIVIPGHGDSGGTELIRHTLEIVEKHKLP